MLAGIIRILAGPAKAEEVTVMADYIVLSSMNLQAQKLGITLKSLIEARNYEGPTSEELTNGLLQLRENGTTVEQVKALLQHLLKSNDLQLGKDGPFPIERI